MKKAVKNSIVASTVFFSLAIVAFIVAQVLGQVIFGQEFSHIDRLLLSAIEFFPGLIDGITSGDLFSIIALASGSLFILILLIWFIVLIAKKTKGAGAFVAGIFYYITIYLALVIFVFDTKDIIYKDAVEISKFDQPLLMYLINAVLSNNLNPVYSFGMLSAFVLIALCFIFLMFAFFFDIFGKNKPAEETQEDESQFSGNEDASLRRKIREEINRLIPYYSEENKKDIENRVYSNMQYGQSSYQEPRPSEPRYEESQRPQSNNEDDIFARIEANRYKE